jgi:hypothetical protein
VLPRFAGRPLAAPRFVKPILYLQCAGIAATVAGLMLADHAVRWLWIAGSLALIGSSAMFVAVTYGTVARIAPAQRFERWILAGAAWQLAVAAGSLIAAWRDDAAIVQAFWPGALWGFAGSWIFGVGRRIFPVFMGWRARGGWVEGAAFMTYQIAVAASVAAAWPMDGGPSVPLAAAGASGLLLAIPIFSWRLGVDVRRRPDRAGTHGHESFVRAAWGWLFVALAVGPLWTVVASARGAGVPPLVTDFARHALAFGFVTQIMMGLPMRMLPIFTGNALWSPAAGRAAFYLLNGSVALRALEVMVVAGVAPAAWPFIALAGPPAVAAVLLFSLNVVLTIYGRPAVEGPVSQPGALQDRRVSDVLRIPGALDVLVNAGFTPLANPLARAAMAGTVTLRQACGLAGVPLEAVMARLEALQPQQSAGAASGSR